MDGQTDITDYNSPADQLANAVSNYQRLVG